MCRKAIYPEMNQEVRMEIIDGELYFSKMDVASCLNRHPSAFCRSGRGFTPKTKKFQDGVRGYWLAGITKDDIHKCESRSRITDPVFLSWLDKVWEENRPEPVIETPVPLPVENTEHNFDKEKMKAFFEGAAEFFNMCSKMIA